MVQALASHGSSTGDGGRSTCAHPGVPGENVQSKETLECPPAAPRARGSTGTDEASTSITAAGSSAGGEDARMSPMHVQCSSSWVVDETVDALVLAAVDGLSTSSGDIGQSDLTWSEGALDHCAAASSGCSAGIAGSRRRFSSEFEEASSQGGGVPAAAAAGRSSGQGLPVGSALLCAAPGGGAGSGGGVPAAACALGSLGSQAAESDALGNGGGGGGGISGSSSRGSAEGGLEETLQRLLCDVVGTSSSMDGGGSADSSGGSPGVRESVGDLSNREVPADRGDGMWELDGGGHVGGDMCEGSVAAADVSPAPGDVCDVAGAAPVAGDGRGAAGSEAAAGVCRQPDGGHAADGVCMHMAQDCGGDAGCTMSSGNQFVKRRTRDDGNPHGDGAGGVTEPATAPDLAATAGATPERKLPAGADPDMEDDGNRPPKRGEGGSGAARRALGPAVVPGQWEHVSGTQRFFRGHDDDVLCVAVHPGGELAATGQVRPIPAASPPVVCLRHGCLHSLGAVARATAVQSELSTS